MAEHTNIAWTTHTFNPFRGCTKISPGCTHCYAERMSNRNPKVLGVWGPQGARVLAADAQWREPLKWNAVAEHDGATIRVFCASIADVFEDWPGQLQDSSERKLWKCDTTSGVYPPIALNESPVNLDVYSPFTLDDARARLFALIRATPRLQWLLLTKRPENIGRMMPAGDWPNVWLGASVETQEYAWRIDALNEAPQTVPVRFVSAEPLLGPLSLWEQLANIQWVIVGGESGGPAREMRIAWVRTLMEQCRDANVPVFVKQLGKIATLTDAQGRRFSLDLAHDRGHGGDVRDWPSDLNVRQFPTS